jgi:hypothetical protein
MGINSGNDVSSYDVSLQAEHILQLQHPTFIPVQITRHHVSIGSHCRESRGAVYGCQ